MAEDEYFAKIEAEKKARLAADLKAQKDRTALEERKALHWLRCGKCGAVMTTRIFRGVEIEVCPECGAVLLDRGELEALSGRDRSGFFEALSGLFGRESP
ncbi:MAG: zf-TFIIB domain-containing protein [Deltaproteobacteria bacterium]|nr:zf-TFIIB domain-containing protein [Deltaproteobacteria bacterium]